MFGNTLRNGRILNQVTCGLKKTQECCPSQVVKIVITFLLTLVSWGNFVHQFGPKVFAGGGGNFKSTVIAYGVLRNFQGESDFPPPSFKYYFKAEHSSDGVSRSENEAMVMVITNQPVEKVYSPSCVANRTCLLTFFTIENIRPGSW